MPVMLEQSTIDQIKTLVMEGKTVKEIAELVGVDPSTVVKYRKQTEGAPDNHSITPERKDKLISLYRKGHGDVSLVVDRLRMSAKTVRKYAWEDQLDYFHGRGRYAPELGGREAGLAYYKAIKTSNC